MSGNTQPVTIATNVNGAKCTLTNEKGSWIAQTPGSAVVTNSRENLSVRCEKEGYQSAVVSVPSKHKDSATWGNAVLGGGIGFASESDGILTDEDESTIGLEVAYTADTYGVAFAYTDDDVQAGDGSFYSIQAAYTPEAPYSISAGYEFDDDDNDSLFLGLTSEIGPGSVSLGASTQGLANDHEDNYMYELAYEYAVNDSITVTPGMFIIEDADEDSFGMVVTTAFSF